MRAVWLLLAAIGLSGCGYVGEPMAPALKRPMRVTDLAVVERGDKLVVQFTLPKMTTEGLPIRDKQDVELRYGVSNVTPFRFDEWEKSSQRVPEVPQDREMARVEIPATPMIGKEVIVGVKVHGPGGRDVGWSNMVSVPVVTPLPAPVEVTAAAVPSGVRIEWHAPAANFRIFRKLRGDPNWTEIGTSDQPSFIDATAEYGKSYEYFVQTIEKTRDAIAESELSPTIGITPKDVFPPAVPTGLTAVPGARSIELLWDRNAEKDLAGYRVYRDGMRLTEMLPSPAYSDKAAKPATTYRYQVSSIDTAGNESALSAPVEAAIP